MNSSALARVLGRREALTLAFGAMIGWSWVLLTGPWITQAGSLGAVLAFALGALAMMCVALTYGELAAAMPQAGGEHVYSLRALGRLPSFICSWAIVLGYVSVAAFETVAFPFALSHFTTVTELVPLWTLGGFEIHLGFVCLGLAGAGVITAINIRGLAAAARPQNQVTAIIVVAAVILVLGALRRGNLMHLEPWFGDGFKGFATVLIMVPMMFMGFDVIPQAAAEIRVPHAALGRIIVGSVACGAVFYCAIILAVGVLLDPAARAAGGMTTARASQIGWEADWAGVALIFGGIAGILTTWNAFVVGASRLIYAMAEDGMLPRALAAVHPRYGTPHVALLAVGGLTCLAPWFGRPVLLWLINAGSFAVVIGYALVALSFLRLRVREPRMPRPYRVRYWRLVGGLALGLTIALLALALPGSAAALAPAEWIICAGWILLGATLWRFTHHTSAGPARERG